MVIIKLIGFSILLELFPIITGITLLFTDYKYRYSTGIALLSTFLPFLILSLCVLKCVLYNRRIVTLPQLHNLSADQRELELSGFELQCRNLAFNHENEGKSMQSLMMFSNESRKM